MVRGLVTVALLCGGTALAQAPASTPLHPGELSLKPLGASPSSSSVSPSGSQAAWTVHGRLRGVQGDRLKIDGEREPLTVGRGTSILRDGEQVSVRALKPGDEIRAGYAVRGATHVATQISASSSSSTIPARPANPR